jgi:ligand-binding SRPBCC domain-containing protein
MLTGMHYQLTDSFVVKSDLQATWDFFSRAENLPRITPDWMRFEIRTPTPIAIAQDSILDYTIRWMGIPIKWRTRIIDWSPPRQFIDLQLRGPYALWHHQHTFSAGEDGTVCTDQVLYRVPVPIIGRVLNGLMVQKQLVGIFEYRRKVIAKELGWVRAISDRVLVTRVD